MFAVCFGEGVTVEMFSQVDEWLQAEETTALWEPYVNIVITEMTLDTNELIIPSTKSGHASDKLISASRIQNQRDTSNMVSTLTRPTDQPTIECEFFVNHQIHLGDFLQQSSS